MEIVVPKYAVWLLNIWIICALFIIAAAIAGFCVGFVSGVAQTETVEPSTKGVIYLIVFIAMIAFSIWKRKELFITRK